MGNKNSTNRNSLMVLPGGKPVNKRIASLRTGEPSRRMSLTSEVDIEEVTNFLQPDRYAIVAEKLSYTADSENLLVTGDFFQTFKGTYEDKPVVVTKYVKAENSAILMKYGKECRALAIVGKHPNIIEFIGVDPSTINQQQLITVFESSPYGSLRDYLKEKSNTKDSSDAGGSNPEKTLRSLPEDVPLSRLITWAKQIATAMIHVSEKDIVHRDLALRNVFLFDDDVVKIAKFGFAQRVGKDGMFLEDNRNTAMPMRWMAMESLRSFGFTAQTDVWAYGVTLWEIFTFGQQPYSDLSSLEDITKALADGVRLPKPELAPEEIYSGIMSPCWESDPLQRPSFKEILNRLEEFKVGDDTAE